MLTINDKLNYYPLEFVTMINKKIGRINDINFVIFDDPPFRSNLYNFLGIDIPDLYDNFEPLRGGIVDPRLGQTESILL